MWIIFVQVAIIFFLLVYTYVETLKKSVPQETTKTQSKAETAYSTTPLSDPADVTEETTNRKICKDVDLLSENRNELSNKHVDLNKAKKEEETSTIACLTDDESSEDIDWTLKLSVETNAKGVSILQNSSEEGKADELKKKSNGPQKDKREEKNRVEITDEVPQKKRNWRPKKRSDNNCPSFSLDHNYYCGKMEIDKSAGLHVNQVAPPEKSKRRRSRLKSKPPTKKHYMK